MIRRSSVRDLLEDHYRPRKLLGKSPRSLTDLRGSLNAWAKSLGREPELADLTDEAVAAFLAWYHGQPVSQSRSRHELASVEKQRRNLVALANFAVKLRWLDEPLSLEPVDVPYREPQAWSDEQLACLLGEAAKTPGSISGVAAGPWWVALILLIYACGPRITAIMRLRWSDLYLDERLVLFRAETQKQGNEQMIGYSPRVAAALERIRQPARELVFCWPFDRQAGNWQTLRRHLTRMQARAGLPVDSKSKFHRLRKTTATVIADTFSEEEACRQMGHSDPRLTRARYIQRAKLKKQRQMWDSLPVPAFEEPSQSRQLELF